MRVRHGRPYRRVGRYGFLALAVAAVSSVVSAEPAGAFISVSPGPSFPTVVTVGDAFPGALAIGNFSTPPESIQFPVLTMSAINLVPSCDTTAQDCTGGVETGVFSLSATGIGSGPPSCNGTWTITQIDPGLFRFVPPGGEGTLQLGASEFCVVDFVATPLRAPTVDTNPTQPGVQTNQVASVTPQAPGLLIARSSGVDQTTVQGGAAPPLSPIAVFRPSNGLWFFHNGPAVHWGTSGDVAVPADYDGDGNDDVAVFRPSNGLWFVRNGPSVPFGTLGDVPVPADYDGDGDDDMAVFRPSNGLWFVRNGPFVQLGGSLDVPVPADYDGDGDDDIAVFQPLLGLWLLAGGGGTQFGILGDIPVPADYDGDGDDDVAVFRPLTGEFLLQNGLNLRWGASGDIPVPADYDGDGDDDVAVFRPSIGVWFVRGGPTVVWGTSGDDPLPLAAGVRERYFG
jgi:hypothetical protein